MQLMPSTAGKDRKISYNFSENNYIIITQVVRAPKLEWSEETLKELADKKHIKTIKKARLEYKNGDVVEEKEILAKLK